MFKVIDRQTGNIISTHKTRKSARSKADRLDNIYGGYRYYVE